MGLPAQGEALVRLEKMGLPKRERDNRMALAAALLEKVLEGNVTAAREVRTILGQENQDPSGELEHLIQGFCELQEECDLAEDLQ